MNRNEYLGASELAAAIGWSEYRTPQEIWEIKTGRRPPIEETPAMKLGKAIEPLVLQMVNDKIPVAQSGADWAIELTIPDSPIVVHPDAIAADGRPIEIKTTGIIAPARNWKSVPIDYILQCYCQAYALGKDATWLCWLVGGRGLVTQLIELDQPTLKTAIDLANLFWSYVQSDTPPPPPAQPSDKPQVEIDRDDEVSEEIDLVTAVENYYRVSQERRELEKVEAAMRKRILDAISDTETVGQYRVKVSEVQTTRLDTSKLKRDNPDIYAKYLSVTTSHRVSVSLLED